MLFLHIIISLIPLIYTSEAYAVRFCVFYMHLGADYVSVLSVQATTFAQLFS